MNVNAPLDARVSNRSEVVKVSLQCLIRHQGPMDLDELCSFIPMSANQKTVVRRALMEIARKETQVIFVPAQHAQFFYTDLNCPFRAKIALAVALMKSELSAIVFHHNTPEFEAVCIKIEQLLNEALNQHR